MNRRLWRGLAGAAALAVLASCTSGGPRPTKSPAAPTSGSATTASASHGGGSAADPTVASAHPSLLPGMPPPLSSTDVYAADRPGMLSTRVRNDPAYVYVPDTNSDDLYVIDQRTMRVVRRFYGGQEPQHVVPSYDLRTLYVTADKPGRGSLIPIDPQTGRPRRPLPIDDAYNMYFTPDGRYAMVVQEAYTRLAFYDPHTWRLHDVLTIPWCKGIDHMDFTADGRKLFVSCEYANALAVVDVATHRVSGRVLLHQVSGGKPQDVKLSPDGRVFFVADMMANGVYVIDARTFRVLRFQRTGVGAHGLYISRDSRWLFVTNRDEGSISVLSSNSGRPLQKWRIPGGGSPDMGNLSANGNVLWLSGRYNNVVYAIDAHTGRLLRKIPVGAGPHGLCVWPIPGRYSLGHTGILR